MVVRPETEQDHDAVHRVTAAAFMGDAEAQLVQDLRKSGDVVFSLVAEDEGQVIGHVMFCRLVAEFEDHRIEAAALAPMSVHPDRQFRGVGERLVRAGLKLCEERGVELVVVLGHVSYYPRFGFSAELARKLDAPFSGEGFMALELRPVLPADGRVRIAYPAAFGI